LAKIPKLSGKGSTFSGDSRFIPPPLIVDDKGREIDAKGRIISTITSQIEQITTLKVNKKLLQKEKKVELPVPPPEPKKTQFYDPNIQAPKPDRPKRSFNFLAAGAITKKAEKLRAKTAQEHPKIDKTETVSSPVQMDLEKEVEKKSGKKEDC